MKNHSLFFLRIGLAHIGRVGSVFVTVAITIERYLSSCEPTIRQDRKSWLITTSVAVAILYNVPRFFGLKTVENDLAMRIEKHNSTNENNLLYNSNYTKNNSNSYIDDGSRVSHDVNTLVIRATTLRLNQWYIFFYVFWSKVLLVDIIPWATVIILNFCIWKKLQDLKEIRRFSLQKDIGKQHLAINQN